GGATDRGENAPEIFERETFFQDQREREAERSRAAHREIVDRAVDCELTDVTAREKDRRDDERVGRERDATFFDREDRLIVERLEERVSQRWQDRLLDQGRGELPTAAVADEDVIVARERDRAFE